MSALEKKSCSCTSLGNVVVEEFGLHAVAIKFNRVARRGAPQWWLSLDVCRNCCQHWLVAQEERFNDVYVLTRVSDSETQDIIARNIWPSVFDYYESLLLLGAQYGHLTRYADSEELLPIAIDLVGQRPKTSSRQLEKLLNLSSKDALHLLQHATEELKENGYPYPWRPKA